jgi:hypothetical protein
MKTLFLAANPIGTQQLALDEEIREITNKIRLSDARDVLELVSVWAVRPDDLLQYLNQYKPQIVHFSGHGSDAGEIILVDNNGNSKPVSPQALKALFSTLRDNIQIVVLNACYSRIQGKAISEVIDYVVGMNSAIGDKAAIVFAASFYRALGFDRTVKEAFDQAIAALLLEGIPEEGTPELLVKNDVSPHKKLSASATLQQTMHYESPTAVSIRPALMIVYRRDGWYLQNKGRGAALNIIVAQKLVKGRDRGSWFNPVRVPTLGPGEELNLNWLGHDNETGIGASYQDEDGRPFTSVTGNDLTTVVRDLVIPSFPEDVIRRNWEFFEPDSKDSDQEEARFDTRKLRLERAKYHVETRLQKRPGHRASLDAIRNEVNEAYSDEFLKELIELNPQTFARCTIRSKNGNKPGITLVREKENAESRTTIWNTENQTRLYDDLKQLANDHTHVKVLMANHKHRPLAELLVSIFNRAGWQGELTQVPLEVNMTKYFGGTEVLGYNKFLVEAVAGALVKAAFVDVKTALQKHNFEIKHPKRNWTENSIRVVVGHQELMGSPR